MYTQSEFDAWYQREHPRVLGALTVVAGNPDVAADATAEAFVRAYERWDRVRLMTSPGGRLYSVALNVVRRRARRLTLERELVRRDRYTMGTPWCGGSVPLLGEVICACTRAAQVGWRSRRPRSRLGTCERPGFKP
jgi:RNA polymerase sigma-70 factor (ECF subfamily)